MAEASTVSIMKKDPLNPLLGTTLTCVQCKKVEELRWMASINKELFENKWCFDCHFWEEKVRWAATSEKLCLRIDGHHYVANGIVPRGFGMGFGGRLFKYKILATGEVGETNNLWHQGTIPDNFKERLPDNAVFITDLPSTYGQ